MNDNDPLVVWGWRLARLFVILGLLWVVWVGTR